MLTRIWAGLTTGLKTEDLASLHVCQWQTHKKVLLLYLLWRWICAIVCLAIIVCSSIDIGREKSGEKHEFHYEKWWIYLTNWTVLACVVQAWLAALICTKALMDNNRDFEVVLQTKVGTIQQFYWICYSVATVYSFIVDVTNSYYVNSLGGQSIDERFILHRNIQNGHLQCLSRRIMFCSTFCYWTAVHDPEIHPVDLLNLMVHALLALLMLGDLVIVGHPVRMDPDLYCTAGVGLGYSIFSLVYYLADGTDRQLNHAIYPLLDWQKPGKTIVVCVGGIFFVCIIHIMVCCLCKVRYLIHKKLFVKKGKKMETCKEHARMLGEQKDFTIPSILDLK